MNDTEVFDLCKEVYEKTGLGGDYNSHDVGVSWYYPMTTIGHDGEKIYQYVIEDNPGRTIVDPNWGGVEYKTVPLYTSDYLLEKLPPFIYKDGECFHLSMVDDTPHTYKEAPNYKPHLSFGYSNTKQLGYFLTDAGNPLKALLKLTLALHEAGELR